MGRRHGQNGGRCEVTVNVSLPAKSRLYRMLILSNRNVSYKESLVSGLATIQKTMPAIGGIAFGPLVLQDALFENMDLETMEMVLEPKVEGARHLNELFLDQDLDFFVMFSSLVMVGGNPGQSNYSAANAYMRAIAGQRRKRGLAVSKTSVRVLFEGLLTIAPIHRHLA